jgi:hypothetical protein
MSRQDQKKRVFTQRIDDSTQAAVDGLIHLKQRVFPKKRAECRLMLRMFRVARGP